MGLSPFRTGFFCSSVSEHRKLVLYSEYTFPLTDVSILSIFQDEKFVSRSGNPLRKIESERVNGGTYIFFKVVAKKS